MKYGNITIGGMSLGSTRIGGAKLGNTLVFDGGGSPTPPTPTPTFVDYIQTDGVAYINTGIKGNAPMSMKSRMVPVDPASGSTYICGCRKDTGNTRFSLVVVASGKTAGPAYGSGIYTSDIDVSDSVDNGTIMVVQTILAAGDQKFYVKQDGESSYTSKSHSVAGTITTDTDLYLFALNNHGTTSVCAAGTKVNTLKLYNDKTWTNLILDLESCYYNGEYGMWDHVSDTFFGNAAGSGAFTGPSI